MLRKLLIGNFIFFFFLNLAKNNINVLCIFRHLLEEFQIEKDKWKDEKEKMSNQLVKLLDENEKQQELLAIEFDKNPQCDAVLKSDINKLKYENAVRPII